MVKRFKTFDPQLVFAEQIAGSAIALTNEAKLSLYKKSQKSGIPTNILEEVYYRGYSIWNESFGQTPEQFAFDRVNSFVSGGFARDLDDDLMEDAKGYKNPTGGLTQKGRDHYNKETGSHLKAPVTTPPSKLKAGSKSANRRKSFCARMGGMEGPMKKPNGEPTRKALALRKWNCEETQIDEKRGLWDNIHAKQERIKHGSGEHMRKPGSKGAPTAAALKNSQNEETLNELSPELIGKVNRARTIDRIPSKTPAAAKTLNTAVKNVWAKTNVGTVKESSFSQRDIHGSKHFKNNETSELQSHDINDPDSRFDGTYSGAEEFAKATPGQKLAHGPNGQPRKTLNTIKRVVKEDAIADSDKLKEFRKNLADAAADQKVNAVQTSVGDNNDDSKPHPATQIPASFADRKKAAKTTDPSTGVNKPDVNDGVQQRIASALSKKIGSLQADNAGRIGSSGARNTLSSLGK